MAVNSNADNLCYPTSLPFDVKFHNESGEPIDTSSYIIRNGIVPNCSGKGEFNPMSEQNQDVFYILTQGQIYIPAYPEGHRNTSEYCLENFIDENGTVSFEIFFL
jgi:hypothetical protein